MFAVRGRGRLAGAALVASVLLAAAAAGAADFGDGLVHLRAETYAIGPGPSAAAPAERETTLAPDALVTWVVVISGPADADVQAGIEGAGGRVVGTVPSNAYLVRAERSAVPALRALPFTERVDLLRPSWKISPDLGRRTFHDPERAALGSRRLLQVSFWPGEDPDAVGRAVTAAGAQVLDVIAADGVRRIVALADPAAVPRIAAIPGVEWIDEPGEIELRNDIERWVIQSNQTDVLPLYDHGLLGEGEIIGHIDGQIYIGSCFFADPADNTPGPNHRKVVANRSNANVLGGDHGCHTAGTAAGDREPTIGSILQRGMAPHAKLSHTNIWNVTGFYNSVSNLAQYLDAAHQDGARIHTNSWGEYDDGEFSYTSFCVDVDTFSRANEDDLVLFAVANSSQTTTHVMAPENSKNCLAVAATGLPPNQGNHSSGLPGPTYDGRRKPEVNAPGFGSISADYAACAVYTSYGTSMATPVVAGGVALIRQYFRTGFYPTGSPLPQDVLIPTGALLKAVTINSTVDMTGVPGYPSDVEGWGRILLDDALYFTGDSRRLLVRDVRHARGLATGETGSFVFRVTDSSEPLKITMAFTDQPAAQLAASAPVNDLDLEVLGPTGALFLGNVFDTTAGVSVEGGSPDVLNNVERVIVASPATGKWTVRVRGTSIPLGPQGYAVAVNGGLFPAVAQTGSGPTESAGRTIETNPAPGEPTLDPMRPSPFRTSSSVRLAVPARTDVRVEVYDVTGRRVRSLLDRTVSPGEYRLVWDGRDEAGRPAAAGIYFVRLRAPGVTRTVRGVLLR